MRGFLASWGWVLLVGVVVAASVLLGLYRPDIIQNWGVWVLVLNPSMLMFILKVLYDRYDWVYKGWHRSVAWLWNTDVNWGAKVTFYGVTNPKALEQIGAAIKKRYPAAEVRSVGHGEKVIRLVFGDVWLTDRSDGEARYLFGGIDSELADTSHALVIDLPPHPTSFRSAKSLIDHHLVHILSDARKIAGPRSDTYTLRVNYGDVNPYFGLYVRKLGGPSLVRFDCEFHEAVAGKQQEVAVGKDRLEIVADDPDAFRLLAVRHLAIA